MLPNNDDLIVEIEETIEPSLNYGFKDNDTRIYGTIDDVEALTQSIYVYLSIERYECILYPFEIGFETYDLIGKHPDYVIAELPTRIHEALIIDDRILDTKDFEIEVKKDSVSCKYVAVTIFGEIDLEKEVAL